MSYDAVVVGAGPNGLAAAILLQCAGRSTLLLEARSTVGGGMRTTELTLPGFRHDVCSAVHPLGFTSPFFRTLPLDRFGLEWIHPPVLAAHPLDDGTSGALYRSVAETAASLGPDAVAYEKHFAPRAQVWPRIAPDLLGPLGWPRHPLAAGRFGLEAVESATHWARRFKSDAARALWAGIAAHALQPLEKPATAAIGLVLTLAGHYGGWPFARGGSQAIADALAGYFESLGGEIRTGVRVAALADLPPAKAVLFDVTPRQLLRIAGPELSPWYRWQLQRYRYGMGVFKVDWALSGPVPFVAEAARNAGTVHLGGTLADIAAAERAVAEGRHPARPFVLFSQPTRFDPTRAPAGQQVAWGYCHVPHGSSEDRTEAIEAQIERFAPGFRARIRARHTLNPAQLEDYNANYVGGDINGGAINLTQLIARPALRFSPYRTSARGIYLCSSSTPPGGGVHGLCGFHAARRALRDVFGLGVAIVQ